MNTYLINCTKKEFEEYKDQLVFTRDNGNKSPLDIVETNGGIWVILFLTKEEHEIISDRCKSWGLKITLDEEVLIAC